MLTQEETKKVDHPELNSVKNSLKKSNLKSNNSIKNSNKIKFRIQSNEKSNIETKENSPNSTDTSSGNSNNNTKEKNTTSSSLEYSNSDMKNSLSKSTESKNSIDIRIMEEQEEKKNNEKDFQSTLNSKFQLEKKAENSFYLVNEAINNSGKLIITTNDENKGDLIVVKKNEKINISDDNGKEKDSFKYENKIETFNTNDYNKSEKKIAEQSPLNHFSFYMKKYSHFNNKKKHPLSKVNYNSINNFMICSNADNIINHNQYDNKINFIKNISNHPLKKNNKNLGCNHNEISDNLNSSCIGKNDAELYFDPESTLKTTFSKMENNFSTDLEIHKNKEKLNLEENNQEQPSEQQNNEKVMNLIYQVSFIFGIFLLCEFLAAIKINSLAIFADTIFLFYDFLGYLIKFFSLSFSALPVKRNSKYTFGFTRIEPLACLCALSLIFVFLLFLNVETIHRIFLPQPIAAVSLISLTVFLLIFQLLISKFLTQELVPTAFESVNIEKNFMFKFFKKFFCHKKTEKDLKQRLLSDYEQDHYFDESSRRLIFPHFKKSNMKINCGNGITEINVNGNCSNDFFNHRINSTGEIYEDYLYFVKRQSQKIFFKNEDLHGEAKPNFNVDKILNGEQFIKKENISSSNLKGLQNKGCVNEKDTKTGFFKEKNIDKLTISKIFLIGESIKANNFHVNLSLFKTISLFFLAFIINLFQENYSYVVQLDYLFCFLISFLVLKNLIPLVKLNLDILMEANLNEINQEKILEEIAQIEEIVRINDFHIWSLSKEKYIASIKIECYENPTTIEKIKDLFEKNQIFHHTIQIELIQLETDGIF